MNDVPSFMQNMGETQEEQVILAPLKDDILKDPDKTEVPETPPDEKTPEKTPVDEKPEDEKKEPEKEEDKKKEEPVKDEDIEKMNKTKKPTIEEEKKEVKTEEKKTEVKVEEKKPDEKQTEKKPDAIIEKAIDKATDAIKESKIMPSAKHTELMKAVGLANKVPLIFPEKLPVQKDFWNDDESFNLDGYMKAYTQSLIMGIQKAISGGPLTATVFGLLQKAVSEEQDTARETEEQEAYATGILNKLHENYPVLAKDKDLEETYDSLLQGEIAKRVKIAERDKKEVKRMEYEDFENVLLKLIGKKTQKNKTGTVAEDDGEKTESLKGNVTLDGGQSMPKDEIDDDIAGMKRVKEKSIFS